MAEGPLSLVCIEPRFPGRLGAVAAGLVRTCGYRCRFYCATVETRDLWPATAGHGLDVILFNLGGVARESLAAWHRCLERGLCYAFGCFEVIDPKLPRPVHLVLGRSSGLGSTLFASVALPGVPVVNFFDYFHQPHQHDLAPDMANAPAEYFHWRRAANAMDLLDLDNATAAWTPTTWQRNLFPPEYRDAFTVLHDGVNTRFFTPSRPRPTTLDGRTLPAETRVVTFIATSLDRLRGFDRFWRLANALLRADPNSICIVVGRPQVQRGLDVEFYGSDYVSHLRQHEPEHDPARFWLLGPRPPAVVAEELAASDLHVYTSRPYPVSRSLLEAMACGCVVLAADTEPVREIILHGQTGLLLPADDADAWLTQTLAVLRDPASHRPLGDAAAEMVRQRYSQDVTLPQLAAWFEHLASGGLEPPVPTTNRGLTPPARPDP
jgi:glycosyltransferase involved in cell wall biosynthesis